MTANPIPDAAVDALYDELFRVGRYLHAPVPIDPKGIIRRHLTAAQQQAHPAPPSAPVGVELAALRVQEWLHREHDILCPVQEIEQAMRTPCSCPFTERALDPPPAAVDEAMVERIAALLHEEATAEPWTVAGVEHPGPDRGYYRGLARKVAAIAAQQPAAVDEATRLLRAYRGAPKFSNDHNAIKQTCALEDEIDLFLATQQQEKSCS